jgi:predicted ATPase
MMREAIEAYRATGQRIGLPLMLAALAEAHAAAGATAAALACVAEGRTVAESSGEVRFLAELHRLEGTLHAAAGDGHAARSCIERAIAVAREQGARWWELRAMATLARLALQPDMHAGVRRTDGEDLARLVGSFTEGADLPDVRDARHIVAELRGDRA